MTPLNVKDRILSYIFMGISFLMSLAMFHALSSKGFPDGHLTELDRAETPLFVIFGLGNLIFGLSFFYCAHFFTKRKILHKLVGWSIMAVLLFVLLDTMLALSLDNGMGG